MSPCQITSCSPSTAQVCNFQSATCIALCDGPLSMANLARDHHWPQFVQPEVCKWSSHTRHWTVQRSSPVAVPICAHAMMMPMAPDLTFLGTCFASKACIAGNATPCAMPSTTRAASSGTVPAAAAIGVRAVATDQTPSPKASTALPPYLSDNTPPYTWVAPYPAKNADSTAPQNCLSQPNCSACRKISSTAAGQVNATLRVLLHTVGMNQMHWRHQHTTAPA